MVLQAAGGLENGSLGALACLTVYIPFVSMYCCNFDRFERCTAANWYNSSEDTIYAAGAAALISAVPTDILIIRSVIISSGRPEMEEEIEG